MTTDCHSSTLRLDTADRVAVLTLNRPDHRNAMNSAMATEFRDAVQQIASSDARVAVVTGAGSAFCAGGDIRMFRDWAAATPLEIERDLHDFYGAFLTLHHMKIPTIAAINGPAIGAGGCLALICDMRLAADTAKIGFTFIRLGINPGMGAEYLLSRLVGPSRALELLMTGDVLSADAAGAVGLVNRVVPEGRLMDDTMDLARRIARMPPLPLRIIKENTHAAGRSTLSDILHREAVYQGMTFQDANFTEGLRAVVEKRDPEFTD